MKLKAFSVTSDVSHPGAQRLQRSADFWGWDFSFILHKDDWLPDYKAQQLGQLEAIRFFKPEFFIYVDAWDTVFTGPPQELPLEHGKLTFCGDTVNYPDDRSVAPEFPMVSWEEFRYVNDGIIWGDPAIMQELAADYLQNADGIVNQAYFNCRYAYEKRLGRKRLELDIRARSVLNMMMIQLRYFEMRGNRPHFLPTDAYPLVLHAPGGYGNWSSKGVAVPMPKQIDALYET